MFWTRDITLSFGKNERSVLIAVHSFLPSANHRIENRMFEAYEKSIARSKIVMN